MFGLETDPFTDRTVLIVGATQGVGPALAAELVRRGAQPLLAGPDREALARLAAALGGGVQTATVPADSGRAALALARWVASDHPALGATIWNAAMPAADPAPSLAGLMALGARIGGFAGLAPAPLPCPLALVLPCGPRAPLSRLAAALLPRAARQSEPGLTVALQDRQGGDRRGAMRLLAAMAVGRPLVHMPAVAGEEVNEPAPRGAALSA